MLNKRNKKPNVFQTLSHHRYLGLVQCSRPNSSSKWAAKMCPYSYQTPNCESHIPKFSYQFLYQTFSNFFSQERIPHYQLSAYLYTD